MRRHDAGRVGGPVVVALLVLLALVVAIAATWLVHRETEAVRPESTQPTLPGLEVPYAPIAPPYAPLATASPAASSPFEIEPSPTASDTTPPGPDPLGHVVWGYVLDEGQLPIPEGAHLGFTDALGQRLTSRAGADGSWSMTGLESGRWYVSVGAEGFAEAEAVLELEPSLARVRRDFALARRGALLVRVVTPDGRAFSQAEEDRAGGNGRLWLIPVASVEPPTGPLRDFHGNWSERVGASRVRRQPGGGLPAGLGAIAELELFEPLPLHASLYLYQELVATQVVEPGAAEVVFALDPLELATWLGDIVLTVVDEQTGAPIEGASNRIGGSVLTGLAERPGGRLERHDELPGRYDVWISAPGYEDRRLWIDLAPGETLERTISLRRGVAIGGRAVDEEGRPYPAQIEHFPLPAEGELPGGGRRYWILRHTTQPDGAFDLTQLAPGRWLLQLQDRREPGGGSSLPRMSPNVVVDTRAGPVTDLVVRLEPTSHVAVSWPDERRENLHVRFLDERGLVRKSSRFWSVAPQRVALPPGRWLARVVDGEGTVVEERAFTLADEPVALELGR